MSGASRGTTPLNKDWQGSHAAHPGDKVPGLGVIDMTAEDFNEGGVLWRCVFVALRQALQVLQAESVWQPESAAYGKAD